jgi:hypothetical protein
MEEDGIMREEENKGREGNGMNLRGREGKGRVRLEWSGKRVNREGRVGVQEER